MTPDQLILPKPSNFQENFTLKRLRTFQGPTPPGTGSTEVFDVKYAWVIYFYHYIKH